MRGSGPGTLFYDLYACPQLIHRGRTDSGTTLSHSESDMSFGVHNAASGV